MTKKSNFPMTISYKAIFAFSICMVPIMLIIGGITKSQGAGVGAALWGLTAWLMYQQKNIVLAGIYRGLFWTELIFACLGVGFLFISEFNYLDLLAPPASYLAILSLASLFTVYALSKYFKKQSLSPPSPIISAPDQSKKVSGNNVQTVGGVSNRKLILLIALLIAIPVIVFNSKSLFKNKAIGEFELYNCQYCSEQDNESKCENDNFYQSFLVLQDSVQIFSDPKLDKFNILEWGKNHEEKCIVSKEKNFAFNCERSSDINGFRLQSKISFNGVDKFTWEGSGGKGVYHSWNSLTCAVKR
ncbi:MAG: hypothetical protein RLZZ601_1738 [Pseudomonadota bacterium]|jgi:hypothetical protein